ncbi:MAG TPA: hypothetical protein VHO69_10285, partial [Phototrophicaceae bacterium]|nr:hypothetical protein [Phototrophicaceae bacterium]
MAIFGIDVLTFLVVAPAVAAVIVLLLPKQAEIARWSALALATVIGAVAVWVFFYYNSNPVPADGMNYVLEVQVPWFSLIGASWHVGIDGISAAMVLL